MLVSFVIPPCLSRIRGFYILAFGLFCGLVPPFLLALSVLPPHATYWAYQFPAMCLCCSVEIVWPVVSIYIAGDLPLEDQALGSGLLQTANNVGRALALAIATAAQASVQGDIPSVIGGSSLLRGIQAGQWVNFALAAVSMVIGLGFFHSIGQKGQS